MTPRRDIRRYDISGDMMDALMTRTTMPSVVLMEYHRGISRVQGHTQCEESHEARYSYWYIHRYGGEIHQGHGMLCIIDASYMTSPQLQRGAQDTHEGATAGYPPQLPWSRWRTSMAAKQDIHHSSHGADGEPAWQHSTSRPMTGMTVMRLVMTVSAQ